MYKIRAKRELGFRGGGEGMTVLQKMGFSFCVGMYFSVLEHTSFAMV